MPTILSAASPCDKGMAELIRQTESLKDLGVVPTLKVILVGNHGPSLVYTRNKKKSCEKIGANCEIIHLEDTISEEKFLQKIKTISDDKSVHGVLIQLPLPHHLSHIDLGALIPPEKDVDGFTASNLQKLMAGAKAHEALIPCTPKGIIYLLEYYHIPIKEKRVVIIGRSMLVGKPAAQLFTNYDATVTLCHTKTINLPSITREADIIIVAAGKRDLLTAEHINPLKRQTIIDVGINCLEDGTMTGDVDFESVVSLVEAISPVPGGVGKMTILALLQNLLQATCNCI